MDKDEEQEKLEALTGAPITLTYGEKEYELFPLGLTTMTQLRRWAKEQVVVLGKESIGMLKEAGAPEEVMKQAWKDIYAQMADPMASSAMESPDAIAYWVYLSIKKGDSSVTLELVQKLVEQRGIKELMEKMMALNGITAKALESPLVMEQLRERKEQIGQ